jgi:hypothetical protein
MTTLSYDASGENAEAVEQAEAESYELGEALQNEHESLLAGKYQNAQELEKAYIELQRKLGSNIEEEAGEYEEAPEEEQSEEEIDYVGKISQELDAGTVSDETMELLSQLSPEDLANLMIATRQANKETEPSSVEPLSTEQISEMKELVGGDEAYSNMVAWASQNLRSDEIELYDAVMDGNDPAAIYFAIQALNYRYQESEGVEGQLLTGKTAQDSQGFRSQAELVRAMADPRYDRDPAYRQDVMRKLELSDVDF